MYEKVIETVMEYGLGGLAIGALIYAIWRFEVILRKKDDTINQMHKDNKELITTNTSVMTELSTLIKILVSKQ